MIFLSCGRPSASAESAASFPVKRPYVYVHVKWKDATALDSLRRRFVCPRHPGPDPGSIASGAVWKDPGSSGRLSLCHRSEEHTSELQSLMRISYSVFCLKKKKKTKKQQHN